MVDAPFVCLEYRGAIDYNEIYGDVLKARRSETGQENGDSLDSPVFKEPQVHEEGMQILPFRWLGECKESS